MLYFQLRTLNVQMKCFMSGCSSVETEDVAVRVCVLVNGPAATKNDFGGIGIR